MRLKVVTVLCLLLLILLLPTNLVSFSQLPGQEPGPISDELHYLVITDPSARVAALLSGEIDIAEVPTMADIGRLRDAGFKITETEIYSIAQMYLNLGRDIMKDVKFRRAIAHLMPKEAILDELLGPTAKYEHNFIASTYGKWYNPNIPDVTIFDPEMAESMLDDAGYTKGQDGWRIDPNTGTKMRELQLVMTQNYPSAVHHAFVERFEAEMEKVGIPARIEFTVVAGGAWMQKIFVDRDFDAFFRQLDHTGNPDWLQIIYASPPYGYLNMPGYNNSEFNSLCEIVRDTLNETEAIEAVYKEQEMLLEDLPSIPLYVPAIIAACNPDIIGFKGSVLRIPSNVAASRIHRKTGAGGTITIHMPIEPNSFIQGWDPTATYLYVKHVCDFLADPQPSVGKELSTGQLIPRIAKNWKVESWSSTELGVAKGTKITVQVEDGLVWHDGVPFTAYDVEFAAKYAKDYNMPRLSNTIDKLIDVKAPNATLVEFYYNKTSLFILGNLLYSESNYLLSYPKHLYNPNATIYGSPEGPIGLQFAEKPGVPDPSKFAGAFVSHPNPPADMPWLTCLIGVGPWVFKTYEWGIGAVFVANRNYHAILLETDINFDRSVNILDVSAAARAFGSIPGQPRWSGTVDLNGDIQVNILDLARIAKDFGKTY